VVGGAQHDVCVMRKRWLWVIFVAVALAIGVLAVATHEREPEYGGKKLSEWVEIFLVRWDSQAHLNEAAQASEAIRAMGTNGVRCLTSWMGYEAPPWKVPLNKIFNEIVGKINEDWELTSLDQKAVRRSHAFYAMMTFDYETIESGGGIALWMESPNNPWYRAGDTTFVNYLIAAPNLGGESAEVRMRYSFTAGMIGTNATSAVPVLEGLFNDENPHVRRAATNSVRRIRRESRK